LELHGIFPEVWPGGWGARVRGRRINLYHGHTHHTADPARRRTKDSLMKTKHAQVNAASHVAEARQAEAAKTARLRALRLAKEAADREAAALAAAAAPPKKRAGRPTQPASRQSTPLAS
jgi:hypothetical protein